MVVEAEVAGEMAPCPEVPSAAGDEVVAAADREADGAQQHQHQHMAAVPPINQTDEHTLGY